MQLPWTRRKRQIGSKPRNVIATFVTCGSLLAGVTAYNFGFCADAPLLLGEVAWQSKRIAAHLGHLPGGRFRFVNQIGVCNPGLSATHNQFAIEGGVV